MRELDAGRAMIEMVSSESHALEQQSRLRQAAVQSSSDVAEKHQMIINDLKQTISSLTQENLAHVTTASQQNNKIEAMEERCREDQSQLERMSQTVDQLEASNIEYDAQGQAYYAEIGRLHTELGRVRANCTDQVVG